MTVSSLIGLEDNGVAERAPSRRRCILWHASTNSHPGHARRRSRSAEQCVNRPWSRRCNWTRRCRCRPPWLQVWQEGASRCAGSCPPRFSVPRRQWSRRCRWRGRGANGRTSHFVMGDPGLKRGSPIHIACPWASGPTKRLETARQARRRARLYFVRTSGQARELLAPARPGDACRRASARSSPGSPARPPPRTWSLRPDFRRARARGPW